MERKIKIDGKELRLVTNGATPRVYRGMFRKDIFMGMAHAVSPEGEILDTEVFENLAYCAAVQGGSVPSAVKIEDWLASFENPMAIVEAVPDIIGLWAAETETTADAKKE